VTGLLLDAGASRVLDLGCGAGRLLAALLAQPRFEHVTGIDSSAAALAVARGELLAVAGEGRLRLVNGSLTSPHPDAGEPDAITLVEVIEHLDPSRLSAAERTVFAGYRAPLVLVSTPNAEYNPLLGLPEGRFRDPDHRFEWPRSRFRAWCAGVARRHGYSLQIGGIGEPDPVLGSPTQYALFKRVSPQTPRERLNASAQAHPTV
jgi:SAM-dependent methyltransferase